MKCQAAGAQAQAGLHRQTSEKWTKIVAGIGIAAPGIGIVKDANPLAVLAVHREVVHHHRVVPREVQAQARVRQDPDQGVTGSRVIGTKDVGLVVVVEEEDVVEVTEVVLVVIVVNQGGTEIVTGTGKINIFDLCHGSRTLPFNGIISFDKLPLVSAGNT